MLIFDLLRRRKAFVQARGGRPAAPAACCARGPVPLAVAVLIDLEWSPRSGGHVKCWERLAEAAARAPHAVDLTVHVLGPESAVVPLAANARFVTHRALVPSDVFPFLAGVAAQTDLAPFHPWLLSRLGRYHVVHTTETAFAAAATARLAQRWLGVPLVASVHTDTPEYTRVFSEAVIRRFAGQSPLAGLLVDRLGLPERLAARMQRWRDRYHQRCDWVLVGQEAEAARLSQLAAGRVSVLRRGIDTTRFAPEKRDRGGLRRRFGIPKDRVVLAFAGRLDPAKNVMRLGQAARALLEKGLPVHVLVAGAGPDAARLRALLGPRLTTAGHVDQEDLAMLYASADVFVYPTRTDVSPNVVLEAKACALPVVVAPGPKGGGVHVRAHGEDGVIVPEDSVEAWSRAIAWLVRDEARRRRIGRRARRDIADRHPAWDDVLAADVLPAWRAAHALSRMRLERPAGHGMREGRAAPTVTRRGSAPPPASPGGRSSA